MDRKVEFTFTFHGRSNIKKKKEISEEMSKERDIKKEILIRRKKGSFN